MQTRSSSPEAIDVIIDNTLRQHGFMSDIYALGIPEADVRTEIEKYRLQMMTFMTKHVSLSPHSKKHDDW